MFQFEGAMIDHFTAHSVRFPKAYNMILIN